MDEQVVKNIGGALQMLGLVLVINQLISAHRYRGDFGHLRRRFAPFGVGLAGSLP
jgi:hypothetical protein